MLRLIPESLFSPRIQPDAFAQFHETRYDRFRWWRQFSEVVRAFLEGEHLHRQ